MEYKNNSIIVTLPNIKNSILKELSNQLINIKIYTINELIKKLYFDYNEETILYVMKKYNCIEEIAKIYIKNIYYVDKSYNDEKINFINELNNDLKNNNMIIENKLFKESLKDKDIYFYNITETKYNKKIIKELENIANIKIINDPIKSYDTNVIEFNDINDEVIYVCTKICELLNNGIDINKIYLTNLNNEYHLLINKYFKMFNIPVELNNKSSIYSTKIVNEFINNYESNISNTIELIKSLIINEEDNNILNKIIKIINNYTFTNDYLEVKELIINDLKNTYISNNKYKYSVKEVDLLDHIFNEDDHVFIMSFNQNIIPKTYKDEDYFNDKEYEVLSLDTSVDKNIIEKTITINKIKSINNKYITYKKKSITEEFYISSLIEDLNYNVITIDNNYNYSNLYNKIKLTYLLDDNSKYNIINDDLKLLSSNYQIPYNSYDNNFKGIDKDLLYKYINNKLTLSYTSLNNYNKCSFSYYLNYILKLNIYEETFMQIIGNIFHEILEHAFTANYNYDLEYENLISKQQYQFNKKELFFLKKLKKELQFIIDTINNQNKFTTLNNELYEENIITNIEGNINIYFTGKIDKIKYKEENGTTILAIIDYKTGNPEINLNNSIYGIELQLPIYIYLAKKKFTNIKIAGFYLQKILNNEIKADYKHSYEQLKKDHLKLQGYSNEDISILEQFDTSYVDSNIIKSMKTTANGFYVYSKIMNESTMNKLNNLVEQKIKETATNITNASFEINPKQIGKKNVSCEYCKFKDICFMKEKQVQRLKEYKNMEFLGDDNNA